MSHELEEILRYIKEKRGFNFSGNRPSMIERRIENRLSAVKRADLREYLIYLEDHPDELNNLIDALTINVSRFFRETLTFEYIARKVLPAIVQRKAASADHTLRVWSTGCSTGEEPYSIAILLDESMKKEDIKINLNIIATDIDEGALKKAREGTYFFDSIKNIKYRFLKQHFAVDNETYTIAPEIKELVKFSFYDMLDNKTYTPPESVFGDFDLILCRNLLIYFQPTHQEIIFDKLFRSLAGKGFLVLGEAEILSRKYQRHFRSVNECCHIYQKN